ncbi:MULTISPECIES: type II toxin-antitoxin system RelE/ParE family toxin [unclassified Lacticaseibacillus]|uniref:type II toxin-antitoxin system RelE/ParE family toxin n=1 Tax=unclassified Lacticaseibacillus TaxID=2759744 RepID=UPI001942296A|nr:MULTISPECIES: type II toxin-antitoxin system RelE/ParE family toxin [unclassified Lacticaseibacillus]
MYIIDFYEDKDGYSDFQTYLEKLLISHDQTDRMVLKKMRYQMKLLENLGPALRMPQVKELKGYTSRLFELRPLPERVFFSFSGKDRYVILSHYTKRQNRTDPREILRALSRLEDWLKRKGKR